MRQGSRVLSTFPLPAGAPEKLNPAVAEFERLAELYRKARAETIKAESRIGLAETEDARAVQEAAVAGKPLPKNVQANEDKARKAHTQAQVIEGGVERALDEAGNALALAVVEVQEAWLDSLDEIEAQATERYHTAIAEAQAAADEIGMARSGTEFLTKFNGREAAKVGAHALAYSATPTQLVSGGRFGRVGVVQTLATLSDLAPVPPRERRTVTVSGKFGGQS